MMGKTVTDDHWGEQALKQRTRRQWAIRGVMVALGVVFVLGTRFLVAANAISPGTTAIIAVAFVAIAAVLGWVLCRRQDEIQRRIAINAYAVMGLTCLMLIPLAGGVGPLLGLKQPMLAAYMVAVLTVPISIVFQRIRG